MLPRFPLSLPAMLRARTVERGNALGSLEQGAQTLQTDTKKVGTGSQCNMVTLGGSKNSTVGSS